MGTGKSFNLEIRLRNAPLLNAIRRQYGTAAKMVKAHPKISYPELCSLVTMQRSPFLKDGQIKKQAAFICDALNLGPNELWPEEVLRRGTKKSRGEVEVSGEEVAKITSQSPQLQIEQSDVLLKLFSALTSREREVISQRYINGSATYEDVAQDQGVSRERIRQIELKGFRKMRKKARVLGILDLEGLLT